MGERTSGGNENAKVSTKEVEVQAERTELYTSVAADEDQTQLQQQLKELSLLDRPQSIDGGRDSASRNLRMERVPRPSTRATMDTPMRPDSRFS